MSCASFIFIQIFFDVCYPKRSTWGLQLAHACVSVIPHWEQVGCVLWGPPRYWDYDAINKSQWHNFCYGFSAPETCHVCREGPSPHLLTWPLGPQTALLVSAYGKSCFSFFLITHGPQMRIRKLSSQRCPIPHNCSPNANQFLHISDYQFLSSLITTQTLKFSLGSAGTL